MKRTLQIALGLLTLGVTSLGAQLVVPELTYDVQIEPLKLPGNLNFGEVAGVATNSKGDVFVYTRTGHPTISLGSARPFAHGGSRMFRFDKTGKYVGEIGQGSYAGQHLDGRSDGEYGPRVRLRGPRRDAPRTQGRIRARAGEPSSSSSGSRRRGSRCRWRSSTRC
jgi:hypothetical protein